MNLRTLYERAVVLSKECETKKRHVSFILSSYTGDILAHGVNRPAPVYDRYRSLHSEDAARLSLGAYEGEITLVNFRLNTRGDLRNSKPCPLCAEWVYPTFDRVYYSTDHGMVLVVPFTSNVGVL
jgi:hypothetical protein